MSSFILTSDYVPPVELTGFIRTALFDFPANQHILAQWLPNVTLDDNEYRYLKGQQGLAEASVFRSWDAESRIGRREGISQVMGELPPISEKMVLSEFALQRMRHLADEQLRPFIERDALRIARNIAARLELARSEALFSGQLVINENGVQQTVSFGRSGSHSVTVSTAWTDHTNATPLDDIDSALQTYVDDRGELPAVILTNRTIQANFRACDQVKKSAMPLVTSGPTITPNQMNDLMDSLGYPPFLLDDAKVKVAGSATRITPADKILFLPAAGPTTSQEAGAVGATFLGRTVESDDPDYALAEGEQPGIVAANYLSSDPRRLWTHAVAIALPVLTDPDATFQLDVL